MINIKYAHKFSKDDISKIEYYEIAIADTAQTWDCHHRLEFTLDGEFAHSRDNLKRLGMYYDRPYFELIFLTHSKHQILHNKGKKLAAKTRQKISDHNGMKGKHLTSETKKRISESNKGKHFTNGMYGRLGPMKGKHHTEEALRKISEASKARWARYRAEKLNEQN